MVTGKQPTSFFTLLSHLVLLTGGVSSWGAFGCRTRLTHHTSLANSPDDLTFRNHYQLVVMPQN